MSEPSDNGSEESEFPDQLIPLQRLRFREVDSGDDRYLRLRAEMRTLDAALGAIAVEVTALRRESDREDELLRRAIGTMQAGFALLLTTDDPTAADEASIESLSDTEIAEFEAGTDLLIEVDLSRRTDRRLVEAEALGVLVTPIGMGKTIRYKARLVDGEFHPQRAQIEVRAGRATLRTAGGSSASASDGGKTRWLRSRRVRVEGEALSTRYIFYGYFKRI